MKWLSFLRRDVHKYYTSITLCFGLSSNLILSKCKLIKFHSLGHCDCELFDELHSHS
uniref:Uncharacterized protein n=1 Tax=Ascaris lumbricoides TaxID=6252 RepID=A0A0M3HRM3_ASCLU